MDSLTKVVLAGMGWSLVAVNSPRTPNPIPQSLNTKH